MKLATTLSDIDMLKNDFKFVNKMGKSYKLLRAKSKLEVVSAAEEKAKSIVSNLTQTLDKLKSKTEAAKKEKDLIINGEVAETKEEIKKALLEIKNKLREQLVFDTLRGDWKVAFGIWEFDPLKLSNPFPDNRISAHIRQGYENKVVASKIQRFVTQKLPSI
eukprot:XP_014621684.1 protein PLASTID MOVEMENT IMPAIRED 15-like [Glycine max]